MKFKDLVKENNELRDSLDGWLPIDNIENERCWDLINELIKNELQQYSECAQ